MADKAVRIPGPDHPITIEPSPRRVVVTAGGRTIADTDRALTLREASYPPVQYVPRDDVDMAILAPSRSATRCPYKGDASYFGIVDGSGRAVDVAWTYEAPHDAVAAIRGYLAFYPDRVDAIEERP